ncbi:putative protein NRT1/ PTR FAMILY 2.14 [Carica papaya]|uniref:putative protein NRT1/ PTR FAMILY 2.14 n=1 Tax=Carica papaya TaxID=3649 RepID=UPI000B8D1BF0|nr:putative protein NRT1/ PTR FAMILY 2.14 [Carica papaya]
MDEESGNLLSDSEECQRQPAGWKIMPFILGNETFERLASYGLIANFMVYLQREYHMDQVKAATIINAWYGVTNFTPLIGAFISDVFIGKFQTIIFGSFTSLLGMMIMTATALVPQLRPPPCPIEQQQNNRCIAATNTQLSFLILSMLCLAIGTGGVKPCSVPFSIDQFDQSTSEGQRGVIRFFNWYYTTQTIILLISQTLVVYVQNDISWALGFGIPTVLMLGAIVLFIVGSPFYVCVNPKGSTFSSIIRVFIAAYRKRRLTLPTDGDEVISRNPPLNTHLLSHKLPFTDEFRFLNKAAITSENEVDVDGNLINPQKVCSIQQIEDVKRLIRIIPIGVTSIIGFLASNQQQTFAVSQAQKMDRHIMSINYEIPAGSISVISLITIGIWLPFYDTVLLPPLRRLMKHEDGITVLQKVGIGNIFAALTMMVSGLVEQKRRDLAILNGTSNGVAPMSVMWLATQLVLMGFSQVHCIVGLTEFYNEEFPDHMRSIGNSMLYLTTSLASYISSLIVTIVRDCNDNWLTENVNTSKLDYFYYLIAGLITLNFFCYLFCACRYQYKNM